MSSTVVWYPQSLVGIWSQRLFLGVLTATLQSSPQGSVLHCMILGLGLPSWEDWGRPVLFTLYPKILAHCLTPNGCLESIDADMENNERVSIRGAKGQPPP